MDKNIKDIVAGTNDSQRYVGFTEAVKLCIETAIVHMFPGYFATNTGDDISIDEVKRTMGHALSYVIDDTNEVCKTCDELISRFLKIYDLIISDIDAAYRGDPATTNYNEIILTYPCFRTISAYRIAHELYSMGVEILPRAISEYEHRLTGIDIHPGATIGRCFFIDHGTGVVIGETTIIGDNVTLYQNVTLGAKSFPHDDEGALIKGIKRHPNIDDNVVVYAGATILGDITIGKNSVIGGNTWVVDSVPPNSKVFNKLN